MSRLTGTHDEAARVVVAGAFPVLRLGIGLTLRGLTGVRVVGEASCAFSCLALALETQADIVVIDTGLADLHQGFDLCRRLKALPKAPKVLMYSADNSPPPSPRHCPREPTASSTSRRSRTNWSRRFTESARPSPPGCSAPTSRRARPAATATGPAAV